MNLVVLKGNISRDIDLKFAAGSGTAVAKFNIAVARMKKDETDFINCIAFGKTAELISERLKKGSLILIEGHIQTGSYDHKEGYKVYTTDVIVNRFEFIGGKKESVSNTFSNIDVPFDEVDNFTPEDCSDIPF